MLVALLAAMPAPAMADDSVATREITALIDAVGTSGCRFRRNGRWHDGADAARHLQRKYAYLHERGLAADATQFIERAGSRSSVSGREYRVACADEPELSAGEWFTRRLQALRRHGA